MTQRLSIQRNMIYHSCGSLFYLACQWLISVLAVRLGSYADGGMLSLAVQLTNFFFVLATFSIRVFQAADTTGRFSASRYISTRLLTMMLGTALCTAFAFLGGQYDATQRWCIVLYMVFKMSEALVDAFAAEQQKAWRMDYCGVSFVMRGALSLAAFTAGMMLWHSLPMALLLMAAATFPVVLWYDGRIVRRLTGFQVTLSWKQCLPLLRAAWPMMVNSAMMTLLAVIPRYFLEYYAGTEVLGIYAAIATPAVIMQAGCSFIYSPLVAPLSEKYAEGDVRGFRQGIVRALMGVALVAAAAVLAALVLGRWGLALLFGESILPHAPLLVPSLLAALCSGLVYFFEVPLTIAQRLKSMTLIHVIAVAMTVMFSVLTIPSMGMAGVNLVIYLGTGGDALAMGCLAFAVTRAGKRAQAS